MQSTPSSFQYHTRGGIAVQRSEHALPYGQAGDMLAAELDNQRGVLFSSSYEFPGRYSRQDIGFCRPPLQFTAKGRQLTVQALNARGQCLLPALEAVLSACPAAASVRRSAGRLRATVVAPRPVRYEEERSRQPSIFSLLREIIALFASRHDAHLGLYGAFGYELAFQFEDVHRRLSREAEQRDLVLYLPDALLVTDHARGESRRLEYEFEVRGESTRGLPRTGETRPFVPALRKPAREGDHRPGEYAGLVRRALDSFRRGDLFETVPGQVFHERCRDKPSVLFRRLKERNPAPYGALLNLGEGEYLVAASPEMYVRVAGRRVETCPVSGTIPRGRDAIEDAEQVRALLNSVKDEAELSMCTDVDRNDKARVCEPGSVRVIGRRQIEMYSRLIHTVDHVEGRLKPELDALDAFLSHAWAVTVTGAPKRAAMQFIEDHEKTPRRWYGGALGCLNFNGDMNTGLTLRTIRIAEGMAEVRAGATLLADSDPEAEEAETRLKAAALLDVLRADTPRAAPALPAQEAAPLPHVAGLDMADAAASDRRPLVLMVDHHDSFVHTLSGYFQMVGARVRTVRVNGFAEAFARLKPTLVVLSPGPGRPADFAMADTISRVLACGTPLFGVCLGLQGIVQHFGGDLALMEEPVHGKPCELRGFSGSLFEGVAGPLTVGRYHSLAAGRVPECLRVSARSADGVVMAVEHRHLPVSAVQFHPESILSLGGGAGAAIIRNVVGYSLRHSSGVPSAGKVICSE